MLNRQSPVHSLLPARAVRQLENFNPAQYKSLRKIGINFSDPMIQKMMHAMDAVQPTVTTGSISTPLQFLQFWLPGFVFVVTAARKIDDLVGIMTTGSWEDAQIVQGILERTGLAVPYGDLTNVPLGSWNVNFNYRSVIRFEEGLQVGALEAAQSARMAVNDAQMKREASALSLEIARNNVGFFGYNAGNNNTYGFLNDPGEPAYINVASGIAGTMWSVKTYLEIVRDILSAVAALRNASGGIIDPKSIDTTLAVATIAVDFLSQSTDFGYTVNQWIRENYPRMRVVDAVQLNAANGGANVFYLYADRIQDMSTDGGQTFIQMVPAKFQVLGVQQMAKMYEEDYSNALAGVMCKRPWAMVRRSGI